MFQLSFQAPLDIRLLFLWNIIKSTNKMEARGMDVTDNAEGNGQQRLVVRNYWTGHTGVGESRGFSSIGY
jgi:hypothetical protein